MSDNNKKQMSYERAIDATVPFGKYKGKTLGQLIDDDLRYLSQFLGDNEKCQIKNQYLQDAVIAVLSHPGVAGMVEERNSQGWK